MDLSIVDHILTTTRSVRKRLDLTRPVEPEVVEQCLSIAIQAPTGSNRQHWYFQVVTDVEKRAKIAEYYKKSFEQYIGLRTEQQPTPADPQEAQMQRVVGSARYLGRTYAPGTGPGYRLY